MVGRSLALIGRIFDLVRVVEDRRRERPALVDVEALVDALVVRQREAGEARIGAADQRAARLDLVERAGLGADAPASMAATARSVREKRIGTLPFFAWTPRPLDAPYDRHIVAAFPRKVNSSTSRRRPITC